MVVAPGARDWQLDRRAGDHVFAGRGRARAGRGSRRGRAGGPGQSPRRDPGGRSRARLRGTAWPRGAAAGARFGSGGAGDSPFSKGGGAPGVGGDRGGWELRRAFVRVRLAADRGRDPDRGDCDRRGAAASRVASRAARRRHRNAGVGRDRVVHGAEQQRLRPWSAAAAPFRPSRHRSVRLDDCAGDRGGRDRETAHAGRAGRVPSGRATDHDPVADRRPDPSPGSRSPSTARRGRASTRSCSPARRRCRGCSGRPGRGRLALWRW